MIIYQSRAPDVDGHGRVPYVQMLKPREVTQLASAIREKLGFPLCDETLIQKRMRKRLPTILEHAGRRLWIDRYYIAVEDDSSGFHYLYLTRRHAEETLRDHQNILRMGQTAVLDSKTLSLYSAALNSMRVDRRAYITYPLPT